MKMTRALGLSRSAQVLLFQAMILPALFLPNKALTKEPIAEWTEISAGEFEKDFSSKPVLIVAMCPETSPMTRPAFRQLVENELLKRAITNRVGVWKATYSYGETNESVRLLKRLSTSVKFTKEPTVSVYGKDRSISTFAMTDVKGITAHVRGRSKETGGAGMKPVLDRE